MKKKKKYIFAIIACILILFASVKAYQQYEKAVEDQAGWVDTKIVFYLDGKKITGAEETTVDVKREQESDIQGMHLTSSSSGEYELKQKMGYGKYTINVTKMPSEIEKILGKRQPKLSYLKANDWYQTQITWNIKVEKDSVLYEINYSEEGQGNSEEYAQEHVEKKMKLQDENLEVQFGL